MVKLRVEIKYSTLVGARKQSAVIPYEVEVKDIGEELTPQQVACTHALTYFLQNYIVSEGDTLEVKSVTVL